MKMFQGFTINLLRDALQQVEDINQDSRKNFPNIVWSVYDRIDVRATNSLQEFFDCSFNPNFWIGEIQSLYLFPFQDDNSNFANVHIKKGGHDSLFSGRQSHGQFEKYTFFSIVTVDISEKLGKSNLNSVPYELLHDVCDRLLEYASDRDVVFDVFQSLGTEDVVFIFLGNKISNIIKSVYFLRSIQIQISENDIVNFCATTYSLLGLNLTENVEFEEDTEAMAQVSITLKDGKRADKFLEEFSLGAEKLENSIEILIGEYDVQFTCKATGKFLQLYQQDGALTAQTDLYNEYILQSKTVWYIEEIDENHDGSIPFTTSSTKIPNSSERPAIKILQKRVEDLDRELSKAKKPQNGTKPNINIIAIYQDVILFINEFIKIMSSCSHTEWLQRLENIALAFAVGVDGFLKNLSSSSSYVEIDNRTFEQKTLEINEILDALRNALSHMHKSGEHFYNVPHPSIYYSGSAHKILMAYYNFIDLVLSLGYLKPHAENTRQSRISFFITFEMINKVQTKIYFKTSATQENRLVGFELPYAALYDFKKYIPALLHEVYHLVAPFDRVKRNEQILHLWIYSNIYKYFLRYLEQVHSHLRIMETDIKPIQIHSLKNIIDEVTRRYLSDKQDSICRLFVENIERYGTIKSISLAANIMDLDHFDFIQLLYQFNDDRIYYSEFIQSVLLDFDKRISVNIKEKAPENVFTIKATPTDEVVTRAKNPKNLPIIQRVAREYIPRKWEEKYNIAIKEAICDVFFSDVLDWSIQDYLAHMLDVFHDTRMEWSADLYQEISVRIGTVMLYFSGEVQYQDVDGNVTQKEKRRYDWIEKQVKQSSFSKEDKKKLLTIFEAYKSGYHTQVSLFMSLIKPETINYAIQNFGNNEQKRLFVNIAERIRELYNTLKEKDLFYQTQGILSLQNDFKINIEAIKAPSKQTHTTDALELNTQRQQQYFVPEIAISDDLGQFFSTIYAIQALLHPQKSGDTPEMTGEKKNLEREELWYRGVCNSTYGLIPSLFRNLPKHSGGNENTQKTLGDRYHVMPYSYQVAMIRQAYMQTKTYYSILEKNEMPLAVRQAFFQHYGVQTNFLDFSTNPLAALYWALNPDNESDRDNVSEAAVYVFSPEKYQKAVNTIQVYHGLLQEEETDDLYPYHTQHCLTDEYVVEDMSDEHILKLKESAQKYQEKVDGSDEHISKYEKMPLITIVPQKNDRILAQSGCFVAYNLLSAEEKNVDEPKDHCFDYLTLDNIQKEYVRICQETEDAPKRFLFKILIPVIHQNELNRALSVIFNYSTSKMYPDIDKLLKETGGSVEKYFKKDT